jgi:hypothetical protein
VRVTDGQIFAVSGASRCGKTALVKQLAGEHARLLVWDIEDQWDDVCDLECTTREKLLDAVKIAGNKKIRFVASRNLKESFEFFAACAMLFALRGGSCAVVAEELADVTSTSKAGDNWGMLVRRGLKRGITIYAISQRWQEADKTALGNSSVIICFRQSTGVDDGYMARASGASIDQVGGLLAYEYLFCDKVTRKITKKRTKIKK